MSSGSSGSRGHDEASRWVAGLNTILSSEQWHRRVAEFVDDHCWVFRDPEGGANEYYSPKQHDIWLEFHSMAERVLEGVLAEVGGSMERLLKALDERALEPGKEEAGGDVLASLLRALLTFDDFLAFADMMKRRCEDLERQGARPSVPDHAPPMAASTALQLGVSSAALESHIAASKHEALQMSEAATNLQYEAMRLLGERSVRRAVNQASQWIEDNFATANTHVHELLCTGEDDAALELALAQHFLVGVVSGQHADVPEGGGGELALQLETANLLAFAQFALGHAQEADAVLAEARALGRGRTFAGRAQHLYTLLLVHAVWTKLDRGPQAANLNGAADEALASIEASAADILRSALAHRVQSLQRVYQASAHPEVARALASAMNALLPGVEATAPPTDFRMSEPVPEEARPTAEAGEPAGAGNGGVGAAAASAGDGAEATDGAGKSEEDEASAVSDATLRLIFSMLPYIASGDSSSSELVLNILNSPDSTKAGLTAARDADGYTLLIASVFYGALDVVKALLGQGVDVSEEDDAGMAALHYACQPGVADYAMVEALLSAGANANQQDTNGCTPLHYAASTGLSSVVALLLLHGAEAALVDGAGYLPADYAAQAEDLASMQLLRTHAPTVGQTAAQQGDGAEDGAESEWVEYVDPETGHPYYLNVVTGESQWEPPEGFPTPDQPRVHFDEASIAMAEAEVSTEDKKRSVPRSDTELGIVVIEEEEDEEEDGEDEEDGADEGKEGGGSSKPAERNGAGPTHGEASGGAEAPPEPVRVAAEGQGPGEGGEDGHTPAARPRVRIVTPEEEQGEAGAGAAAQTEHTPPRPSLGRPVTKHAPRKRPPTTYMRRGVGPFSPGATKSSGTGAGLRSPQTLSSALHEDMVAADPATADSVRAGGQVLRLHRSGSKGEGLRDVVQEHRAAAQRSEEDYERRLRAKTHLLQQGEQEKASVASKLQLTTEKMESLQRKMEEIQGSKTTAEDELERLKRELDKEREDRQQALQRLNKVEGKLTETEEQKQAELKRQTEEREKALASVREKDAALKAMAGNLQSTMETMKEENERLKQEFLQEQKLRREYHNQIEEMKGAIRVYCRIRPMSGSEKRQGCTEVVSCPSRTTVQIADVDSPPGGGKSIRGRSFEFDVCFGPGTSQAEVFEDTKRLVQSAVDGFNVTVFAYGQTGAGKTFTMYGDKDNEEMEGVTPRAIKELFAIRDRDASKFDIQVKCYMLELYRDDLVDLLLPPKEKPPPLSIHKDSKGVVYVENVTIRDVGSAEELFGLLDEGNDRRHVAETKMNATSSRSHSVASILLDVTNKHSGVGSLGKLTLVDLAGSERVSKTGASGDTFKESQSINKSLSALGDVIAALTSGSKHVPYRNHPLTMLMSDSLGGNAKTLMFVNAGPADYNAAETINSLNYAQRVKKVTNKSSKSVETAEIRALKKQLEALKQQLGGSPASPATPAGDAGGEATPASAPARRGGRGNSGRRGRGRGQ